MGILTGLLKGAFGRKSRARSPIRRAVDDGQLAGLRLNVCTHPASCGGACCRRGVQMLESDATRIVAFVQAHPEHFELLRGVAAPLYRNEVAKGIQVYSTEVVTAEGPGKQGVYHAERAGHVISTEERKSAHCVFRYPDTRCSLQVASVALGEHKWAFKPTPCWLFPLQVKFAGERGGDRCYRLEHAGARPEYSEYPCHRLDPDGPRAEAALAEEIACFRDWFPANPERFVNEVQGDGATVPIAPAPR